MSALQTEHDEDGSADAAPHGTLKGYLTGFVLAVILTAIPFWAVAGKLFDDPNNTRVLIIVLAGVQIIVHMVYFLHMNARSERGWNLLALIFTTMLVVIALSGSIWIMHHLDRNMMPPSMRDMSRIP
ncbi:cytochrome o ubiquinol oxidase subunit IV [Burkholderia alba]|uniref:cytochrome o ubiquinol oxidase subunit IV n=1 Tax=Burkholderia alba TaxID=2683677 RepID=UPI002B054214|nr:cytochrome o ubiquinol oxidase subunit IV [Burkholderia alba]